MSGVCARPLESLGLLGHWATGATLEQFLCHPPSRVDMTRSYHEGIWSVLGFCKEKQARGCLRGCLNMQAHDRVLSVEGSDLRVCVARSEGLEPPTF